ncbi:hypothetical protein EL22_28765 [Halostagnicola sp. A56]|nr:hypothetical protein EL22_28765 [Halostagnicola sp. A56]
MPDKVRTEDSTIYKQDLFIDGKFVESTSGERFEVENPANREIVGSVPDGTVADIEADHLRSEFAKSVPTEILWTALQRLFETKIPEYTPIE